MSEGLTIKDKLKVMLMLESDDQDKVLDLIIEQTASNLRFKLGLAASQDIPEELSFVMLEVCVRRFNRLKNEGMASYSQEGESITFKSNDFDDFLPDIDEWKRRNADARSLGSVRFINPYGEE